jgi:hypothetical protein
VSARIEKQLVSYLTKPVARISTLEAMYRAIFQPAAKDLILKGSSHPIIRQSLRGSPALAKRITDTNPEHEIQITTLQNFLTGHAQTDDRYVALFHRFAEGLT